MCNDMKHVAAGPPLPHASAKRKGIRSKKKIGGEGRVSFMTAKEKKDLSH